jgi:hypothetical protein
MSLEQYSRSRRRSTICIRAFLAFTALFALLAARSVAPNFPQLLSHHASISAASQHDQKPRFDCDGLQWVAPSGSFLLTPPAMETTSVRLESQLLSTLQTKGFHYNRPPPSV